MTLGTETQKQNSQQAPIPRNLVPIQDRWNVEALFSDRNAWEQTFEKVAREKQKPHWPELDAFRGHLADGPEILKSALDLVFSLDRVLSKLYTYAHLRHDENIADDVNKAAFTRISTILHDFQHEVSWFDPEILSMDSNFLKELILSPILKDYRFHLEKLVRMKPHTLSSEGEELVALAGKALQAPQKTFSAISDADFKFESVKDSQGIERPISHALYGVYIRDQDRKLRENAFKTYHGKYLEFQNTLCELLAGQVNKNQFHANARRYNSCVEAALFPHNIDPAVYHSLINAVHQNLESLHKYVDLRRRILKLDKVHLYDMYVPLTSQIDIKMDYPEAEEIIVKSVAPLGAEYQRYLKEGLQKQRWIDRYENLNKRSGAYSSGCYDSMPYILMNYKGLLRDVFTLAHEAGHSMHSLLSRKTQPYQYSDYQIFVAEVASTFNEELLTQELLKHFTKKEERIFIINQKIDDIRGTLFRQAMFAEFELKIHEMAENNNPLTPTSLKNEYHRLNETYFGPHAIIDQEIDIEWARIPHFYYNFYVYQYSTGISAALALADRVRNGGDAARESYLNFLKSGGSKYPLDLLSTAGINMRSPEPVSAAIAKFSGLVDELDKLIHDGR
jgi:oligoendopeptidase F